MGPEKIGGYQGLSRSSIVALNYVVDVISKDHDLKSGSTPLFWHLVSTVAQHLAMDKVEKKEGAPVFVLPPDIAPEDVGSFIDKIEEQLGVKKP